MKTTRKDLDRIQLLEQMIEDELVMGEPVNFAKWMTLGWAAVGGWYLWSDWRLYKLSV